MTPQDQRALDALIAEKVMGWTRETDIWKMAPDKYLARDGETYCYVTQHRNERFTPTADPAQAFTVLEKISEGREISIHQNRKGGFTLIATDLGNCKQWDVEADSLALGVAILAGRIVG